ncbi:MAG: hypothetical protein ACREHD_03580 [Pirellulales bacterium]
MSNTTAEVDHNLRIAELEREVRELHSQIAELRSELHCQANQRMDEFARVLQQLVDMTNELLPGDVRVENGIDPEYPNTPSIVFRVTPHTRPHDTDATIDKEIEWHRAARKILPDATCYFGLAID